jgi:hypothetical protein
MSSKEEIFEIAPPCADRLTCKDLLQNEAFSDEALLAMVCVARELV